MAALDRVIARTDDRAFMDGLDEVARDAMRSGAIQHFEFTYALCWKFIKRWLGTNISQAARSFRHDSARLLAALDARNV